MRAIIVILLYASVSVIADKFTTQRARNFSIELLYFTQLETDGHVVISPFGIWTLLNGVSLGATENSLAQIRRALRLPKTNFDSRVLSDYKELTTSVLDEKSDGVTLRNSNFVFLDNDFPVDPVFSDVIQKDFGASVKVLDFKNPPQAAKTANNFINNVGARVTNVLTSDDFTRSKMILSNVISFKGLWSSPFNETETKIEPFYDEDKKVIGSVKMMYQRGQFPFSNVREVKAFVVELPYGSKKKYSLLILLPHPNQKVVDTYKSLANFTLTDIMKRISDDNEEFGLEDIDLKIPRLKISTNVILNKPLNDLGIYDIFQPTIASFKRVTSEKIFVSAIVHKADFEVTEAGTVASAATTASFSDRISTPIMQVNKPFVYFVIEKSTTTVIFGGIYSNPSVF